MREIIFRGKMKTDILLYKKGQWVYGDYARMVDGKRTIPHIYGFGEVIPETVGQYTGLEDKNGKKIFEGDILEFLNDDGDKTLYIVEWDMSFAGWIIRTTEIDCGLDSMECWDEYKEHYEVIGNIHDNGELLEAKR